MIAFDALCDLICWEAGNFYCTPGSSDHADSFGMDSETLMMALREIQEEFLQIWNDYHDLDVPEIIQERSPHDRFGEVAGRLFSVITPNVCISKLYTLLPYSRAEILSGIKELHNRQYLFVVRESEKKNMFRKI